MSEENKDIATVLAHAGQLSEQFDTVQIVVTRHLGKAGTQLTHGGIGNVYAREGSVRSWLKAQETAVPTEEE